MASIEDMIEQMFRGFGGRGGRGNPDDLTRSAMLNMMRMMRNQMDVIIESLEKGSSGIDPYQVLGVSPSASKEEVDKAYRRRAEKAHPDKGGTNEEMKVVNLAYMKVCQMRGWT